MATAHQYTEYGSNAYYNSYYGQQQYPTNYYPSYDSATGQIQPQTYAAESYSQHHYGQPQSQAQTTVAQSNYGYQQQMTEQTANYNQYYYSQYDYTQAQISYHHQQMAANNKSAVSTQAQSQKRKLSTLDNDEEDNSKTSVSDSPALRALLTNPAKKLKYTPTYYNNGVVSPPSTNYDRIVPEIVPPSPNKTDDSIDFLDQNLSLNHIQPSPSSQSIIDRISTPPLSPKEESKTAASSPSHSNPAVNQSWMQNGTDTGTFTHKCRYICRQNF
jgi:hypothetical protein